MTTCSSACHITSSRQQQIIVTPCRIASCSQSCYLVNPPVWVTLWWDGNSRKRGFWTWHYCTARLQGRVPPSSLYLHVIYILKPQKLEKISTSFCTRGNITCFLHKEWILKNQITFPSALIKVCSFLCLLIIKALSYIYFVLDIEVANRHGHTCLMIACYKGHLRIACFLIDIGAELNRKTVKGNTALHDCAESGSLDIMKLLLSRNARMDVDSYGKWNVYLMWLSLQFLL